MKFHPNKCNLLRVTRRKKPITTSYRIREHQLEEVETAKYLGVILSKDLSWKAHVKMVTCKANHTLSFLQRNVSDCPKSLKELSYKALVRPQVEYCSSIWDPHHKTHVQQIEGIQNRAARFVFNDYSRFSSVSSMKAQLGWENLQARRKTCKVVLLYKVINCLVDLKIELRPSVVHPEKFTQMSCRTVAFQRSFTPDTITLWNSLPTNVTSVVNVDAFRCSASGVLAAAY